MEDAILQKMMNHVEEFLANQSPQPVADPLPVEPIMWRHRVATLDAAPLMSAAAPEEEAAPAKREMTPRREYSKKYAASVEEAAKIDKRKPWF